MFGQNASMHMPGSADNVPWWLPVVKLPARLLYFTWSSELAQPFRNLRGVNKMVETISSQEQRAVDLAPSR
jgi:hypothetical protein